MDSVVLWVTVLFTGAGVGATSGSFLAQELRIAAISKEVVKVRLTGVIEADGCRFKRNARNSGDFLVMVSVFCKLTQQMQSNGTMTRHPGDGRLWLISSLLALLLLVVALFAFGVMSLTSLLISKQLPPPKKAKRSK